MSTLTIVSSVEGWTMPDDAGDTVSLKCCASSFASLSSVGSVLEKDQQIVAALVNIIPSSENARSPRDPPHMTAEGSRFHVYPNSHLQFLNTQRITHVVICGTGTTSGSECSESFDILGIASETCEPAQPRDADWVDFSDSPLQLVSGACDGSDVAEPADSDEAIESFTLHKTSFKQAVRLAPRGEPTRGTGPTGSILRLGDARRHRTPLKLAKTGALLSRVARPLTSACRSYTPLGLGVPQINVRNVPVQFLGHPTILELMEAGNRNCQLFGQSNKTPSDGKDRPGTAPKSSAEPLHSPSTSLDRNTPSPKTSAKSDSTTPERHARPHSHTKSRPQRHWIRWPPPHHFLPLFSPPPHTLRRQRTTTQTARPRRPHSQTPFASEGPRELERTAESCSCDDAPVLAREWDALAATLEASPKVGLAPHNPPTPPLFPKYGSAFCECEEESTDNASREGEGCGCEAEAPFLIVSPIGLGGSAVVARSISLVRVPSSLSLRVLFCFEARHYRVSRM
ncbi:hypothetical protein BLNAU_19634 [Blattamonas nauphoetae]|uniref:Uncharacterized protein n=1 Tax=Blattamonas nauphoetae TaxID=2049346 RepID=A0ABQ9X3E3_9EUKA|nr:hypothetical protein BLNAU_19634 [Blattamonas nauphoetae]